MIEVRFPARWQAQTGGAASFTSSATTMAELLGELRSAYPDLQPHLGGDGGGAAMSARLILNGAVVRDLSESNSIPLKSGDSLGFILPLAGG